MPRPDDRARCAVCVETMQPVCDAADFGRPGVTHLQFMWDRRMATHCHGMTDEQVNQHMVEYALNRMLAPFRDNKNKKEGKSATRIVKSRNTRTSDVLSKKCHVRQGAVQCMRNAGHEGAHKF